MIDEKKPNHFFDSLNSITTNKEYWFNGDPERTSAYSMPGINSGLSQHLDAILFANEMNIHLKSITKKMHYDYLFYSIRKMNRGFQKWVKGERNEDIEALMKIYKVNRRKAEGYATVLSSDQVAELREDYERGR
jgi:hypothetical protein